MRVLIKQIKEKENECLTIECVEITADIESIRSFALTKGLSLVGQINDRFYSFNLSDVIYFEAVDERVFAYTFNKVFELKIRLYELENAYKDKHFIRCSKSYLINLLSLDHISPALNGRFIAQMSNGQKIIVSRQYVPDLKRSVFGGK